MVADGSMPGDADAYVLLSDSSKACIGGASYKGYLYGEGVCGLTPDKRVTINWYKRDALSSALVSVILQPSIYTITLYI